MFQPYLTYLWDYARTYVINPEVKFGWHATWAYATDSQHGEFINYDNDQMAMFQAIMNASQQAMVDMDFDILIPSGTEIQNARTNHDLNEVGYELTSDGHHLEEGMGRFVAGLTVFEKLIANTYKKNLFHDVSFYPPEGSTEELSELAKVAAKYAVINPFVVTTV